MTVLNKEKVNKIFSHIPTLKTERLILRKMKITDSEDMFEYSKDPEVTKYLLWSPHTEYSQSLEYLRFLQGRYRAGDFYDWGIVLKDSGKMIGTCGFTSLDFGNNSGEVGYVINRAYWGKGIASEALAQVMRFGFMELNLHRLEARYMAENVSSRRVMEKCGMSFEGIKRSSMFVKGLYRDIGTCSILSDEYIRKFL